MSREARLSTTGPIQISNLKVDSIIRPKDVDVVILCGGKGTRLRPIVSGRPKPMSEFGGRPFLSILMEYAAGFGFKRFVMCAGYLGKSIEEYYEKNPEPAEIIFCLEKSALGTGGAIRNAKRFIRSDPFLVMNGDSFAPIDLGKFLDFHLKKKALLSMALVKDRGNRNSGKVSLDQERRITRFEEKKIDEGESYDNAGIYLMNKQAFPFMKETGKFSLEYDLFPSLVKERCFGYVQKAELIDFGTPGGYRTAKSFFAKGTVLK